MTELPLYVIDSFSSVPFSGNPAAVCLDVTKDGLSEEMMQKIAAEINLSETAFVQKLEASDDFKQSSRFGLRWFTPTNEVPMCGHATLASAACMFRCVGNTSPSIAFKTLSGDLITKDDGKFIGMDFPVHEPKPADASDFAELIKLTVGEESVREVLYTTQPFKTLILRLDDSMSRSTFSSLAPQMTKFAASAPAQPVEAVITTVKAQNEGDGSAAYDYFCRFFSPWFGLDEDPVAGAAETMLAPYWAKQLGKKELNSRHCSARGGDLRLALREDGRLDLLGPATLVIKGNLTI